jgi:RNA-directed DNA polymerase
MESLTGYLTKELRLEVNPTKSRVVTCDQFEYLGFSFKVRRGTIQVSEKSTRKFKHRIRELTGRSRGISMDHGLSRLHSYVRGWMGDFGLAAKLKLSNRLDQWLRRRIRACYWKQRRGPKRKREMLIRLGVRRLWPLALGRTQLR